MESNQYLDIFIDESKENLQVVNDELLNLEKDSTNLAIVDEIFRAAHTLKGMAATMGYEDLSDLTHKMENVLDAIRQEQIAVTTEVMDVLLDSVEYLEHMITDIAEGGTGAKEVDTIVTKLKAIESGETVQDPASETTVTHSVSNALSIDQFERTVLQQAKSDGQFIYQIKVALSEDCLLKVARVYMIFEVLEQSGEVIKSVPTVDALENEEFDQHFDLILVSSESSEDLKAKILKVSEVSQVDVDPFDFESSSPKADVKEEISATVEHSTSSSQQTEESDEPKKAAGNKTIRVNIERLDALMNLFEEMVIDRGRLEQISEELDHSDLKGTVERISRISGDLQNTILTMRMVPIDQVFNRFPRMVRQLTRDLGKKIDMQIEGAETELDRTVIDEIGDPLVHLIRNAVDHGVETPEERQQAGKDGQGQLLLKAFHSGNHVFVQIKDDGKGINQEKVLAKAIENGVITDEQSSTLTGKQINELILESGFSTAQEVSDISGRGVGLDVVKSTIESLGGSIEIESELGQGTTFTIQLPLTLSIISVMLVVIENETYAIPLSSIIETAVIKKSEIMKAHNKEVIDFRGNIVPLVDLKEVFEVPSEKQTGDEFYSVVVVRKGDQMAGLVVDSFIGQQEIVLKGLGNYLSNIFAISGATILGNGEVALIVDSNALIK
ncbi:two-component system chemotaxis sensor kinase CheA [Alkalibacillus filiformis]|uniref:Chemotaxis protein CheA n=1 Tax=Alkalibacillus filiformis TaxID=200990 RepID=A0ABU0DQB9_9BACI|nr:chemotaxis protein CheA [Alkalibacillus filiformis]MDQ0350642.1 two-component system chemotaxis sensor kinase CheA [Alkalibacillus filiformis]